MDTAVLYRYATASSEGLVGVALLLLGHWWSTDLIDRSAREVVQHAFCRPASPREAIGRNIPEWARGKHAAVGIPEATKTV